MSDRQTFETLEPRRLFAGAAAAGLLSDEVRVIGPSAGLTASVTPIATALETTPGVDNKPKRDTGLTLKLDLMNSGGVKETSLKKAQFEIFAEGNPTKLATGNVNTSGGADTITVKPTLPLEPNTNYFVYFNSNTTSTKITNINNEPFAAASFTFRTGTDIDKGDPFINFTQSEIFSGTTNSSFSAITIGPDGKLYTGTLSGYIYRFDINSDGTLSNKVTYTQVRDNNGGARFITGLTFDPRSVAAEPVLWVSHGQAKFGDTSSQYADNFTGKISRLYKSNYSRYEDVVVGIPRSVKDHLNNQIGFDKTSKSLYFVIPSLTAMGAADSTWGNRSEVETSAAMFRLQLRQSVNTQGIEQYLATTGPVDLSPAGAYNPYRGANPLRFYATGLRNAFDMVFHSNGHLYLPANGSAAGGNTPATPADSAEIPNNRRLDFSTAGVYNGSTVTQMNSVQQTIEDYLYDVKEGGYYGQPNPTRAEYILNGGNPTSGLDTNQISSYPVGTQPDRNYKGSAFSFGVHQSPNGAVEYKSDAFGGRLKGYLIITRYSSGQDLIAVKPNDDGTIDESSVKLGITGFTGLANPLDIVENPANGNLYVTELVDRFGIGKILVLKPTAPDAQAVTDPTRVGLYATPGDNNGVTRTITLRNDGTTPLDVDVSAIKITGLDRRSFVVTNFPSSDFSLLPGENRPFIVKYVAGAGETQTRYGNLAIATNDPDGRYASVVQLRGFLAGTNGSSLSVRPVAGVSVDVRQGKNLSSPVGLFGRQSHPLSFTADDNDDVLLSELS